MDLSFDDKYILKLVKKILLPTKPHEMKLFNLLTPFLYYKYLSIL